MIRIWIPFIGAVALAATHHAAEPGAQAISRDYPVNPVPLSHAPPNCPFKQSPEFTGVAIVEQHNWYGNSDTWYLSWASDGKLYSGWTDGDIGGMASYSGHGEHSTTAASKIISDDPMNLTVQNLSLYTSSARPYVGRYQLQANVPDSRYGMCWQEIKFLRPGEQANE